MKLTKIFLGITLAVFILWLFLALIGYIAYDDVAYRQCLRSPATIFFTFIIGTGLSIVVGDDLDKKLK